MSIPTTFSDYLLENTNSLITEAGLARLITQLQTEKDMAIISGYRSGFTKKENIQRNKKLRGALNAKKMGPYQLVGHWRECKDSTISYTLCPKHMLHDVVERSYMVIKPDDVMFNEFKDFMIGLARIYGQDGFVYRHDGVYSIVNKKGGTEFALGKKVTLGKIGQAYSQYVMKMDIPFVFEGIEVPTTIIGKRIFTHRGLSYPILSDKDLKECKQWKDILPCMNTEQN